MTTFPDFAVACGEEASDPLVSHEGVVVRVDELTASDHLAHQDADLAAVAALGVRWWRYGMPWRWTEPEPGVYDWSWWDRALAASERHGLEPVVDLCHFGLPASAATRPLSESIPTVSAIGPGKEWEPSTASSRQARSSAPWWPRPMPSSTGSTPEYRLSPDHGWLTALVR